MSFRLKKTSIICNFIKKKHNACIYSIRVEKKGSRMKGAGKYVEICEQHSQCTLYTDKKEYTVIKYIYTYNYHYIQHIEFYNTSTYLSIFLYYQILCIYQHMLLVKQET